MRLPFDGLRVGNDRTHLVDVGRIVVADLPRCKHPALVDHFYTESRHQQLRMGQSHEDTVISERQRNSDAMACFNSPILGVV